MRLGGGSLSRAARALCNASGVAGPPGRHDDRTKRIDQWQSEQAASSS